MHNTIFINNNAFQHSIVRGHVFNFYIYASILLKHWVKHNLFEILLGWSK
jgi:hypothetical protein